MAKTNVKEQGSIAYSNKWEKLQSHVEKAMDV